ncbi:MAG: GntR family transcriptional regulator [Candidatus Dormibacteria bacterium]
MTRPPPPPWSRRRPPPRAGNIETYRELREAITGGRFQPNERLVEAELVTMFGAGRSAVRAALVRLDQEGLVTREPNRGARVRLISGREAIEIEQVRIALEKMLARFAAERVTGADLDDLVATVGEMRERVGEGDPLGYSELNARFHRRIWAIADHQLAASLLTTLKSQSIRFQYRTILQPGRAQTSLQEHQAILAALAAHDPDACEEAMAEHLRQVVSTLQRAIAAQPAHGPWRHPTAVPTTRETASATSTATP